jgi:RNA polymerase I-specific transcription initiation factor RRN7
MSYDLPYLDNYRRGLFPKEMTKHMARGTRRALSPSVKNKNKGPKSVFAPKLTILAQHIPSGTRLHALSARLARLIHTQFGITTPESNAAPVLWRSVRALGGAAPLYVATKRIAQALELPLTLEPKLAPRLEKQRPSDPPTHVLDEAPPELAFVSAAIVALKLVYGLDGEARSVSFPLRLLTARGAHLCTVRSARPRESDGLAATFPSFSAFIQSLRASTRADEERTRRLFDPREPV